MLLVGTPELYAQKRTPAVYFMDNAALAKNLSRVQAKDAFIMNPYKSLIKEADKAMNFGPVSVMEKLHVPPSGDKHDYMSLAPYHWPDPSKPDGLPYIRKDGQTNPEVKDYKDKEYLPSLCKHILNLSLAYYFGGDEKYASHAAKLTQVWFLDAETRMNPNMNFAQAIKGVNTGRGAGLIDARHFAKVMDGIGLLKGSKYWTDKDQAGMVDWFTQFLTWMETSKVGMDELDAPNNHGAWYDALRMEIYLFSKNEAGAFKVLESAKLRLDKQMDVNGSFPLEMERTTSLHYSVFVTDAFMGIAQMAEVLKFDFWNYKSPSGKSLRMGYDFLFPFLTKKVEWKGQQIKDFDFKEGYDILTKGYSKYKCKSCIENIQSIEGEKFPRLILHLLY